MRISSELAGFSLKQTSAARNGRKPEIIAIREKAHGRGERMVLIQKLPERFLT